MADHVHGHVVPRWVGDTNFMPVLADRRVVPQSLDETAAFLAQAHLLGEHRTRLGVIRRDHGIIGGKTPFLPVVFRRQVIVGPQMPLEALELLAVVKTDKVVRRHRLLDRNGRFLGLRLRLGGTAKRLMKGGMNFADQSGEIRRLN